MITEEEKASAANRLRDAFRAAADVMTVTESPVPATEPKARRPSGWLLPLAAAVSIVVVALAAVSLTGHFAGTPAPGGGAASTGATAPPEFYLVYGDRNHPRLEVRRTSSGAVTDSAPFPAMGASISPRMPAIARSISRAGR